MKHIFYPLIALLSILILSACTSRPGPEALLPVSQEQASGQIIRLYVATTRAPDNTGGFGGNPSLRTEFRYYDVSVPPIRDPDQLVFRGKETDPETQFLITGQGEITRELLIQTGKNHAAAGRETAIFVHGYNQLFPEALFRLAQLSADAGYSEMPVLFAWPSSGKLRDYLSDRQMAEFSRGALTNLLKDMTPRGRKTTLLGHSVGGWLSMEALRTLRLTGEDAALSRLEVVLASPDIDAYVFGQQLQVIGKMHTPITVLVAQDDRALQLASRLSGGRPRVGQLDVRHPLLQELARRYNIRFVDVSSIEADPARHVRYSHLSRLRAEIRARNNGRFERAGTFVLGNPEEAF